MGRTLLRRVPFQANPNRFAPMTRPRFPLTWPRQGPRNRSLFLGQQPRPGLVEHATPHLDGPRSTSQISGTQAV